MSNIYINNRALGIWKPRELTQSPKGHFQLSLMPLGRQKPLYQPKTARSSSRLQSRLRILYLQAQQPYNVMYPRQIRRS